jgi:GNAT superfamily N-acetyltransferase
MTVAVRPLTQADVVESARLHAEALDMEFLARCGPGFLRAYHRAWLDSPDSLALAAVDDDGGVVGVLLGSLHPAAHYRAMVRRHGASLALWLVGRSVMHPRLARELLVTRAYRYLRGLTRILAGSLRLPQSFRRRGAGAVPDGAPSSAAAVSSDHSEPAAIAEVTHVMVRADARGGGVGRALLERAEDEARRAGLSEMVLVTPPDLAATTFYEHLGWHRVGELTSQSGEQFFRYRFDLRF